MLFSQDQPVWTPQDISTHFGMPRSTTYRYLASLRAYALIVPDGRGGFSLGPRLLHMAQVAREGNPMLSACTEQMQALAERFEEVVVLNERIGQEIVALHRIESPQRIVLKSTRTHLLPWPATGSAKVLLAFAEPEDFRDLSAALSPTAYTSHTLPTVEALLKHLEGVRKAGYATSDEERDPDVWGASVPLLQGGHCRHALSVVGPKFRIPSQRRKQIIDALLQASQRINAQLG